MAKKAKTTIKFNKTTLMICIAIIVILALLVGLAFTPVGQKIIEVLDKASETDGTGAQTTVKPIIKLGGDVSVNEAVVLDNVVFQAHFIDVGQGDAIVLRFNDGKDVMIDAGCVSDAPAMRAKVTAYLAALDGFDTLDYLIVTHPDDDHYNLLTAVLDAYVVENIIYNDVVKGVEYNTFRERIAEEVSGTHNMAIDADGVDYSITGTGYSVNIYCPGYDTFGNEDTNFDAYESNGMSAITVVECAGRRMIFTGDATGKNVGQVDQNTEAWFMEKLGGTELDCDVLKIAHHGSASSSSEAFLDYVKPEYAVVMCDDGGAHSHPDPEVMNRLFDRGTVTYRTNRQGDIVLHVDESGDFAFSVEKEVLVDNNKNGVNDKMLITED